ncbi:MAG: ribosome recycling factor [Bacteroidia bacterium]|jgi:ribosome recycling factor|nr:ribosome recycling factor [Bacteroidales bacterium]MDD3299816.1 ribosome recycling factor [Bacteroidales bacterium]MDD3843040.1 ribosome recycling factor [Bacteroidales bacterium]MDD4618542.1 ribosome recycling factor [Bacteroidales bacterium]NCC46194.1 ribosome recycling factor [Bacteroidia bacterium]
MDIGKQKEVIEAAKEKMEKALLHLEEELKSYRAGKANPAVFNNVLVDYYGSPTPIPQVASVTTPDAKTMLIQPWDKKMIPVIEKAIMVANIGFTPQNNGEHIRINVPPLTEERRKDLVKRVKAEGETARISIRNARRDGVEQLKKYQKEGLPEDVVKDGEAAIQKETDSCNKMVEEALAHKEKEIMTV